METTLQSACFAAEESGVLLHYRMPALCPPGWLDPGSVKLQLNYFLTPRS